MRAWAQRNGTVLERYIAAYVEALRMTMDPTNRAMVVATLARHLALHGDHAERTYQALMVPGWGLSPDAAFDLAGFRNVLALRAEIEGSWSGQAPAPDRYLDLGYYQRALE